MTPAATSRTKRQPRKRQQRPPYPARTLHLIDIENLEEPASRRRIQFAMRALMFPRLTTTLTVYRRHDCEKLCKGNEYWIASKGPIQIQPGVLLDRIAGNHSSNARNPTRVPLVTNA
jgi:hypothetical protein